MPIPEFIVEIRKMIGQHEMWLPGVTAVVTRGDEILLVRRADNGAVDADHRDPGARRGARAGGRPRGAGGDRRRGHASTGWPRRACYPGVVHANGDRASYLDLTFACTYVSGEAHVADDESSDVRWFPRRRAAGDGAESMLQRIADALSGEQAARFVR